MCLVSGKIPLWKHARIMFLCRLYLVAFWIKLSIESNMGFLFSLLTFGGKYKFAVCHMKITLIRMAHLGISENFPRRNWFIVIAFYHHFCETQSISSEEVAWPENLFKNTIFNEPFLPQKNSGNRNSKWCPDINSNVNSAWTIEQHIQRA